MNKQVFNTFSNLIKYGNLISETLSTAQNLRSLSKNIEFRAPRVSDFDNKAENAFLPRTNLQFETFGENHNFESKSLEEQIQLHPLQSQSILIKVGFK